jgi:hypothetical protein
MVTHICNPNYSGDGGLWIKASLHKKIMRLHFNQLKKNLGMVVMVVSAVIPAPREAYIGGCSLGLPGHKLERSYFKNNKSKKD